MCDNCNSIILRNSFYSQKRLSELLRIYSRIIEYRKLKLLEKSYKMYNVKDENGCWINNIIGHVIKYKERRKVFTCSIDTYHGIGSFRKGR